MAFWASFVQKNVHSLSPAPLYPTAPPMPGKRWGGRLCTPVWMAFPKKVILTATLGAFLQEVSPIHASIRGSAVSSLLLRHHDNLTVHVPACWNGAARNSHREEKTSLDLQSKHYFFCGKRVFPYRNKYVLFPTCKIKEYMFLHCKYFGNMCQKPKMRRAALPFQKGNESPLPIAMAARSPALGSSLVSVC